VLRSKAQSVFAPSVFKRFNSDEASKEKSSIESADGEHGSIRSAIDSASESASTYASEATEKVTEAAEYARDSVADVATGAAAAVGYPPRDYQRNDNRQPYNGGRSGGNGNSRSFGGDRGGRDGGYGGDRGRAPQSFDRSAPPDRVLTPTNSVYVGNLLFDVADSDLRREFSQFGDIKSVIIATDARGLSKG
jgi:nucleolin